MSAATKSKKAKKGLSRSDRVEKLMATMSKSEWKTNAELASALGWSPKLVYSTIHLVNSFAADTATEILTYSYRSGWKIAESWDEKAEHVAWQYRHIKTRVETVSRQIATAKGLFGADVPQTLVDQFDVVQMQLDIIGGLLPSASPTPSMSGPTRVEVIG